MYWSCVIEFAASQMNIIYLSNISNKTKSYLTSSSMDASFVALTLSLVIVNNLFYFPPNLLNTRRNSYVFALEDLFAYSSSQMGSNCTPRNFSFHLIS